MKNYSVFLVIGSILSLFGFVFQLRAASTVITTGTDEELRAAVAACGMVTLNFDGVIVLTSSIPVTCAVTIDASGHSVTLSGGNSNRIFQVQSNANLTLISLKLTNGRSTNGGAIYNDGGTITAQDCQFLNNAVIGTAGTNGTNGANGNSSASYDPSVVTAGQPGQNGAPGANASGGAILNSGTLSLWRCFFQSNSAAAGPGGNGGRGGGGGQTPTFRPLFGAAGAAGGDGGAGGKAQGAVIANFGNLTLTSCTFSNSLVMGGTGGTAGNGGNAGVNAVPSGNGGIGGVGGSAAGSAICTIGHAFVSNSLFMGNRSLAANGGAGGGGGLLLPAGISGAGGDGGHDAAGSVYNQSNCILVNCTFNANTVTGGNGGAGGSNFGNSGSAGNGGHAFGGGLASGNNCQLIDLTMSGNAAYGGSGRTNGNSFGGSIANTGGVFQLVNSILSGGASNNSYGVITDLGHNISSDATPAWTSGTSLNNTDPLLLPLANNGGPTLTMALRAGSPALNNADCALAPPTDQRGYARPDGPGCDIGAYEGAGVPQLQIVCESNSTNVLRWMAEASRAYRVEQTANLNGWTPLTTNIAATNGWLELRLPATASPQFFRLNTQ